MNKLFQEFLKYWIPSHPNFIFPTHTVICGGKYLEQITERFFHPDISKIQDQRSYCRPVTYPGHGILNYLNHLLIYYTKNHQANKFNRYTQKKTPFTNKFLFQFRNAFGPHFKEIFYFLRFIQ